MGLQHNVPIRSYRYPPLPGLPTGMLIPPEAHLRWLYNWATRVVWELTTVGDRLESFDLE